MKCSMCTSKYTVPVFFNRSRYFIQVKRPFWAWLNIMFNRVDQDRLKRFGPDRTCAEWLLRNGAAVRFRGSIKTLTDYNSLPLEGAQFFIEEIIANESSIMHYGFPHLVGCKYIKKIVFHKCAYLENEALGMLFPLKESLQFLQISSCHNISNSGLNELTILQNLKELILFDLPYVKDEKILVDFLKKSLPSCNVVFEEKKKDNLTSS